MTYQLHASSSQHIASELPGSRTVEAGTMTATTSGTSSMVCAQPEYTVTYTFISRCGTITAQYLLYTHTTCISPHMFIFHTTLETACRDACDAEMLHCHWHLLQHLPLRLMRHQMPLSVPHLLPVYVRAMPTTQLRHFNQLATNLNPCRRPEGSGVFDPLLKVPIPHLTL